jgi:hypothetical protein
MWLEDCRSFPAWVLTGLHPDPIEGNLRLDDSCARRLLDWVTVANPCAALGIFQQKVLST